ncbi:MAG: YdbL family protein [Nitrospinae bacterium]|nr:YdbL family protein [Nitrospinota bacterium]MZH41346.1 YdbL family protein [Nitrospinota bacterium]
MMKVFKNYFSFRADLGEVFRLNCLRIFFLAILLTPGACAEKLVDVNVTIVDQKTALENQILGSYEELGNDVLLLASVRSVDEDGKLKPSTRIPKGKLNALRAMQRQEFNRDDIQEFKKNHVVGEGNDGLLKFFETERTKTDARFKEFATAIVAEENEDRMVILKRIVATNENFSDGDLPKVQKISASLNRDNAKPGEKIQQEDGQWTTR